jgi:hypothetical protein
MVIVIGLESVGNGICRTVRFTIFLCVTSCKLIRQIADVLEPLLRGFLLILLIHFYGLGGLFVKLV